KHMQMVMTSIISPPLLLGLMTPQEFQKSKEDTLVKPLTSLSFIKGGLGFSESLYGRMDDSTSLLLLAKLSSTSSIKPPPDSEMLLTVRQLLHSKTVLSSYGMEDDAILSSLVRLTRLST